MARKISIPPTRIGEIPPLRTTTVAAEHGNMMSISPVFSPAAACPPARSVSLGQMSSGINFATSGETVDPAMVPTRVLSGVFDPLSAPLSAFRGLSDGGVLGLPLSLCRGVSGPLIGDTKFNDNYFIEPSAFDLDRLMDPPSDLPHLDLNESAEDATLGKRSRVEEAVVLLDDIEDGADHYSSDVTPQVSFSIPAKKARKRSVKPKDAVRPMTGFHLVTRTRQHLETTVVQNYMGEAASCPVVNYLRRDKANTSRARPCKNSTEISPKMRRARPRYLNVLVDGSAPTARSHAFDLFESSPQCQMGNALGRDLEFAVEKGSLLRVSMECIDPMRYPRSQDLWLALRCRNESNVTVAVVHFVLSWWKAKRAPALKRVRSQDV